jgi:hypothetical protein
MPNQITLKRFNGESVPVVMTNDSGRELTYGPHSPFYDQISVERHHESPEKVWQQALYPETYGNFDATLHLNPVDLVGHRSKTDGGDHFAEDCPWRTKLNRLLYQDGDNEVVNGVDCGEGWGPYMQPMWAGKNLCQLRFSETLSTSKCYRLEIGVPVYPMMLMDKCNLGIELQTPNGVKVIYEGLFPRGLTTVAFSTNDLWFADFAPPVAQRTGSQYIPIDPPVGGGGGGGGDGGPPLFQSPTIGDPGSEDPGLGLDMEIPD